MYLPAVSRYLQSRASWPEELKQHHVSGSDPAAVCGRLGRGGKSHWPAARGSGAKDCRCGRGRLWTDELGSIEVFTDGRRMRWETGPQCLDRSPEPEPNLTNRCSEFSSRRYCSWPSIVIRCQALSASFS